MFIKSFCRTFIRKFGFDVIKYPVIPESVQRRKLFFINKAFDLVIDVGANSGQFGEFLRKNIGYSNKIYSFEPLSSAFKLLEEKAKIDSNWSAYNFALGESETRKEINIAGNSFSSSFLNMLPAHLKSAPQSQYIAKEWVEIKTLDSLDKTIIEFTEKSFLKIDAQGFEKQVLAGARNTLQYFDTIQLEISLLPLYEGEPIFEEIHTYLTQLGYYLVDVEYGFTDEATGRLLQIDGLFEKKKVA